MKNLSENTLLQTPQTLSEEIKKKLRDVPDFPKKGIVFKDITPLLSDPSLFEACIFGLKKKISAYKPTHLLGIEARGFLFGSALAKEMALPFVPARKPGKLPWEKKQIEYKLEYGKAQIEIHLDAFEFSTQSETETNTETNINKRPQVAIIDDLLATGGTVEAACKLIRELKADPVVSAFVIELSSLKGKEILERQETAVESLCQIN